MSDICDKDTVEITPRLANMFRRHFDRDYMLIWYVGIINRYVSKERVKEAIRRRYLRWAENHVRRYGASKGTAKFKEGTIAFLNDFDGLDFADIDVLRQLNPREALAKPIRTINGNEIKFMED